MQGCKSHKKAQMLTTTANKERTEEKGIEVAKTENAKQKLQEATKASSHRNRDDK